MKKLGKILLWAAIPLAVLLVVGISFTIGWRPIIGPRARSLTERKFAVSELFAPETLELLSDG